MSRADDRTSARAVRRVLVRGTVQGVAFRYFTQRRARELGLAGWVRNLRDGRVEAHVEGAADAVESMIAWLKVGPPAAHVHGIELRDAEPEDAREFSIAPSS